MYKSPAQPLERLHQGVQVPDKREFIKSQSYKITQS